MPDEPIQPPQPNKDSESYKKLREGLKRRAEAHFEAPQAAPPSVQSAQQSDSKKAQRTPPKFKEPESHATLPAEEVPAAAPVAIGGTGDKRRPWIPWKPIRILVSLVLLGVIAYCGYYIYQFKLQGDDGQIWWPWEQKPAKVAATRTSTVPKTTTTSVKPVETAKEDPKIAEERRRKFEEQKLAQQKAAQEEIRRQQQSVNQQLEESELKSVTALEAIVAGYFKQMRYEKAGEQIAQLAATLTTPKAKAKLQLLHTSQQYLAAFKNSLTANIGNMEYEGDPVVNRQTGRSFGTPARADREKVYFNSQYGEVGAAWESLPADQVAQLASVYLKQKEKKGGSQTMGQDYFNLMYFCLSHRMSSAAAQFGTDAIVVDQSLRPKVKALLGDLIP